MDDRFKVVATGTWLYDGTVPMRISVCARPARFASSRYDDDDQLDETRPIPDTKDGFLYCCFPFSDSGHLTIDEAKEWANAQPWGPVIWD
jgi:hypothetical protein